MHGLKKAVLILKLDKPLFKTVAYFSLGLFMAGIVAFLKHYFMVYNSTPSERIGYYLTIPTNNIEYGNIYTITISDHYMKIIKSLGFHADSLLKRIVGIPGDKIMITESGVLLNNRLLPKSKAKKIVRGVFLEPVAIGFKYRLQKDEYWVMGEVSNSYDSRYFGVVRRNQILKKAIFLVE
ncbi:MAG: signal peptidase I [Neisseriaceae bacterium]|jgi:signal peptidase I